MQAGRAAGENRAPLGAGLVADGDDVVELLAARDHLPDGFGCVARDVDAFLGHDFDDDGIELSGFDPGALRVEFVLAAAVEKRLGHLRPGAVVNADEKDVGFHECARETAGEALDAQGSHAAPHDRPNARSATLPVCAHCDVSRAARTGFSIHAEGRMSY